MRRIIVTIHTTLDGYMSGPGGEVDWLMPLDEKAEADAARILEGEADTILLGRVTYQAFNTYWPTAEGRLADLMNKTPKVVFARSGELKDVVWGGWGNIRLVDHDMEKMVRDLKAQDGKAMVTFGSANFVSSLLNLGLIDEFRIAVHPLVLGGGRPLFKKIRDRVGLDLLYTKSYPSGSVLDLRNAYLV